MVGADVVAARHHALHDQSEAHGVEHARVLWNSIFPVDPRVFLNQLSVQELSPPDKDHEEAPKHHVADV